MSDVAHPGAQRPIRPAITLLVLGLLIAFVPGLLTGPRFLAPDLVTLAGARTVGFRWATYNVSVDFPSLADLMRTRPAWTLAMGTLLVAPAVFGWWRAAGTGFVRKAGAASCVVASIAVCVLVLTHSDHFGMSPGGTWCAVPLGGLLMAAAFVVAPTPRVRDE